MKSGGLFSGIGGFEIASMAVGIKPVWSNDINSRSCNVLRKNFTHEIIEGDIRDCGKGRKYELSPVELIYGGDPCQPHSLAGLGKGTSDDRFLWPEMFRLISEILPSWVVNENVSGSLTNGVVDIKADDLESIGYEVQPYCIPAESVGALHQRERVWIVAHNPNGYRDSEKPRGLPSNQGKEYALAIEQHEVYEFGEPVDLWAASTDPDTERFKEQHYTGIAAEQQEGLHRYFGFGPAGYGNIPRHIIESSVVGMLDGLPEGMDYADRNKRIAEAGNAIVPEVARVIFRSIYEIHYLK